MLRATVPTRLVVNLVGSALLADCFASTPGHPTPAPTTPTATGSRSATTHPSATGPALTPWQRLAALADPIDTTPGEAPRKTNEHLPGGLHPYLPEALLKDADVLAGAVAPRELATHLAYPRLLISGVVTLVSSQYLNQAQRTTSLRVLADISGITYRGQSTDLVGRTGLTFTVTADGSTSQLLNDPQSAEVLAAHERLTGRRASLFSYVLILERDHTTHAGAPSDPDRPATNLHRRRRYQQQGSPELRRVATAAPGHRIIATANRQRRRKEAIPHGSTNVDGLWPSNGPERATPPGMAGASTQEPSVMSSQLQTPDAGPTPDRPRYRTETTPPHTPLRPTWACRACGQPWPCPQARLLLKVEYESALPALSIYLSGLMFEAMRDLFHLNPHDGPSPQEMFDRFVAWGPFRRSILEQR
ncbi:hypothetical protein GA0070615_2168 [Micromonospora aurantiaca]|nr:hypothetical protein GA0070615_2168 [Micromonospora aurantiaca]